MQAWSKFSSGPVVGILGFSLLSGCAGQRPPMPGAQTAPNTATSRPLPTASAAPAPAPSAVEPAVPAPPAPRPVSAAGQMCGGIAGIQCAEKLYCSFPLDAQCGAADRSGTCQPVPEMCTMEFAPVCGCDDKTYGSACVAARSGVSVAKKGACPGDSAGIAEGKLCGTRGVEGACRADLYCAYRSQCGATDSGGKCTKKPEICPHLVAPVCGCDQQTHNNACEAARAGVSVASKGACKPE